MRSPAENRSGFGGGVKAQPGCRRCANRPKVLVLVAMRFQFGSGGRVGAQAAAAARRDIEQAWVLAVDLFHPRQELVLEPGSRWSIEWPLRA